MLHATGAKSRELRQDSYLVWRRCLNGSWELAIVAYDETGDRDRGCAVVATSKCVTRGRRST